MIFETNVKRVIDKKSDKNLIQIEPNSKAKQGNTRKEMPVFLGHCLLFEDITNIYNLI